MSTGLTKIVNQAGKAIGNALSDAQQGVARTNPVTLSDAAIAANRHTADALKRRTTVGDLPRFTVDAINTDGTKAVHEVADMIEQVHASDPEQAQELFARTAQGIGAADRTRLEELLRGGGVIDERLHGRLSGQPIDGTLPDHRTKVLRLEDLGNPDDARRDMLHRPGQDKPDDARRDMLHRLGQDKPEIMPLSAKADVAASGAHPAEADGDGKSSEPRAKPEGRKSLDERVEDVSGLEPDIERPKGLLPMPGKIDENGKGLDNVDWSSWTAPEWVHEGARAVALPKHVLDGGEWSSEDATKAAMSVSGGGAAGSAPSGALRSGVTRLRGTPKFMRKVDLEEQGKTAARKVMDEKSSVPQAMFREDVGEISFDYGVDKEGLKHIRNQRMKKDGMTEAEANDFVTNRIPEVLAHGEASRIYGPENGRRVDIVHQGRRVTLSLRRHDNQETWVLTGYEEW